MMYFFKTMRGFLKRKNALPSFTFFVKQTSCQKGSEGCKGFTLIEMLIVIAILGILMSALVISVQSGYKQARQANCKSNLRQFGVALAIYRGEHDNQTPDWLSNLYPEYVDDRGMYVCRADKSSGIDIIRPEELITRKSMTRDFDGPAHRDNRSNSDPTRNRAIECCSYFYEFSAGPGFAVPPNLPNKATMRDSKIAQMTYGDSKSGNIPYSASRIPIVRCYHHWHDMQVYSYRSISNGQRSGMMKDYITLNVAYAGNVFVGPTEWELTLYAGESQTTQ